VARSFLLLMDVPVLERQPFWGTEKNVLTVGFCCLNDRLWDLFYNRNLKIGVDGHRWPAIDDRLRMS